MRPLSLLAFALCGLAACSSDPAAGTGTSTSGGSGGAGGGGPAIGGDRPVEVIVPPGLKEGALAPLLILLHGYSVNGKVEELYLQLGPMAEKHGFFFAHPDGTIDKEGKYFWNATDACCDMFGAGVDDSAYLASVIDQIEAAYPVDPKRVYLVGHSNGGFMSYRMACDHADKIAAIASLAGSTWKDASKCKPSGPVSVLEIHGTADADVSFDGTAEYPGAIATVKEWAGRDGCAPDADTTAPTLDLDDTLAGAETTVDRWAKGCAPGGGVELWTIPDGSHVPNLTPGFRDLLADFLLAHPKP